MAIEFKNTGKVPRKIKLETNSGKLSLDTTTNTTATISTDNKTVVSDLTSSSKWVGVNETNKIYGDVSFENKEVTTGLYTTDPVLSSDIEPFTIEFYSLINSNSPSGYNYLPLFTIDGTSSDQGFYRNKNTGNIHYYRQPTSTLDYSGSTKLNYNEINKITITYDTAALRVFINDELDLVVGVNSPILSPSIFSFYKSQNTATPNNVSYGLLDNVNIHKSIATKVRDPDPYEEFLVVDLPFDGENNSMKIVDNGVAKSNWTVNGNAKLSTDQKFDGFSSLYIPTANDYIYVDKMISLDFTVPFTISFEFYIPSNHNNDYNCIFANDESDTSLLQALTVVSNVEPVVEVRNTLYLYFMGGDPIRSNNKVNYDMINKVTLNSDGININLFLNGVKSTVIRNNSYTTLDIKYIAYSLFYNNANFKGYIKNFKIYKGVAVIPESPVGKIQLDFDNNVVDKYGNSTWTNNGVTFDKINSVKGYSAYFSKSDNTQKIQSTPNPLLDYGTNDFKFEISFKQAAITTGYTYLYSNGTPRDSSNIRYAVADSSDTSRTLRLDDFPSTEYNDNLTTTAPNTWYTDTISRKRGTLITEHNDVIVQILNIDDVPINMSSTSGMNIGGVQTPTTYKSFVGYVDNLKFTSNYTDAVIDKPTIHFPLAKSINNIGLNNLTTTVMGTLTHEKVDGIEYTKFSQNGSMKVTSNGAFDLGLKSDFILTFNFMWKTLLADNNYPFLISNGDKTLPVVLRINSDKRLALKIDNVNMLRADYELGFNVHYKAELKREGNISTLSLLDRYGTLLASESSETPLDLNFKKSDTNIGGGDHYSNISFDGYISEVLLFTGTSKTPETFNKHKVLDLNFKPTRKAYLFKDNNNKCIIHPVNITQRDYQDSQYCCTFNGTSQHLKLGKNDLFNFGNDDFIMEFVFKKKASTTWAMLLCDNANTTNFIDIDSSNFLAVKMGGVRYDTPTGSLVDDKITKILIKVENSILTVFIDDVQTTLNGSPSQVVTNVNFNLNGDTFIGCYYNNTEFFNGTIYSIKVLRNTTDLTLLEDNTEEDDTPSDSKPMELIVNKVTDIINPPPIYSFNISGTVYNISGLPNIVVKLDGVELEGVDVRFSKEFVYTFSVKVYTSELENGSHNIEVLCNYEGEYLNNSQVFSLTKDVPLSLSTLDSFGLNWYQKGQDELTTVKNRVINGEDFMYFNGASGLYSTSFHHNIGLSPFTIEFDIIYEAPGPLLSYGVTASVYQAWWGIYVDGVGSITVNLDRGNSGYSLTTPGQTVRTDGTPTRIAITRDSDYNVRVFKDGEVVATSVIAISLGNTTNTSSASQNASNMLWLGHEVQGSKHFRGSLGNLLISRGTCKYTSNYTVAPDTVGVLDKVLLDFSKLTTIGSSLQDSYNKTITWNNSGCIIENNKLKSNANTSRLLSSESSLFLLSNNDWTLDFKIIPTQVLAEATLLDLRPNSSSFSGILIRQTSSDPTSITVSIGYAGATSYNLTLNTGINSIKPNTEANIKLVRAGQYVTLYLDGVSKSRVTIGTNNITTSNVACLGNILTFDKPFQGYITHFRLINTVATDLINFTRYGEIS